MTIRANIYPDASSSIAAAMGATAQWLLNRQKPRATVPEKASQGATPATKKFDGTCDGLKGRDLVFDSADTRADWFTHVRHEISKYAGNSTRTEDKSVGRSIERR